MTKVYKLRKFSKYIEKILTIGLVRANMPKVLTVVSIFSANALAIPVGAKGVIFGHVTDSITGESLPFANINSKQNPRHNFVADENGSFRLGLPLRGRWEVSYAGYDTKIIPDILKDTVIEIRLSPMSVELAEVVIRPRKEKYSKKNNPAVDFVNSIRRQSGSHNPLNAPYYSYDKYEKTVLGLNDFRSDFSKGFLSKKGKVFENYVDTSSWTGKRILDLMLKEKTSTRIASREEGADKEIVRGYRSAGLDEVLNQENMQIILEDAIREIDIFSNNVVILQNRFVSPLSSIGPDFYKYYLTDTVYVEDEKCVELSLPHIIHSRWVLMERFTCLSATRRCL